MRKLWTAGLALALVAGVGWFATTDDLEALGDQAPAASAEPPLEMGQAEADITPPVPGPRPVYLAGFGHNRRAQGVNDPLFARCIALRCGGVKIALVSVDLIGWFYENTLRVREQLKDFTYVLISSTHNHEGPDTMGLWGESPLRSGVDPAYVAQVEERIVRSVRAAEKQLRPASARIGRVQAPELLHDSRLPYLVHDELVVLRFHHPLTDEPMGLVVQWNCHPETLSSKNVQVSADFVGYAVAALRRHAGVPVTYFTGTVGGLMTSLRVKITDEQGRAWDDGTVEKTRLYGERLAAAAERALSRAEPLALTPLVIQSQQVYLPMANPLYHLARRLGVLQRDIYLWQGDPWQAARAPETTPEKDRAIVTEIAVLTLGELQIVCVPGEIYPELVLDRSPVPLDPGADFPDAAVETPLYRMLKKKHKMILGLANDEIGYIIPKRQWDVKAPFAYDRKSKQYGEENSIGPETAPLLARAFEALLRTEAGK